MSRHVTSQMHTAIVAMIGASCGCASAAYLADAIGVTRAEMSAELQRLKRAGVVRNLGPSWYVPGVGVMSGAEVSHA